MMRRETNSCANQLERFSWETSEAGDTSAAAIFIPSKRVPPKLRNCEATLENL